MAELANDYDAFYQDHLAEKLNALEDLRLQSYNQRVRLKRIGFFVIFLLILNAILWSEPISLTLLILLVIVCFGMAGSMTDTALQQIKPEFKKVVIYPILRHLYRDIEYRPTQKFNKSVLNKSLLLGKKAYRSHGDDFVQCKIGETHIQFAETEAYDRTGTIMIYAGIFVVVSFNKSFKGKTVVLSRKNRLHINKATYFISGLMKNAYDVNLEDPNFNKRFKVVSEDQIEARYLLTTNLMERLMSYQKNFSSKVSFSFIDNRLFMSIPVRKNMFEPRILKPINDKEFIKKNYDYFKLLTDVVEELDLNTRIWL